jgi:Ca2+-binding EF-hand superfamily protein
MKTNEQLRSTLLNFTMPTRRAVITVAMAAFAALGGCATNDNHSSGQTAAGAVDQFNLADANHDGQLSRDETSDFLVNEIFASRDANHDGRLTQEEWTGGYSERLPAFQKRDANHDGIVTKEEAIDYARKYGVAKEIIRQADKNGDDKLSRAEVEAYYASREGPPN